MRITYFFNVACRNYIILLNSQLNPLDVFSHPLSTEWDEISVIGYARKIGKSRFAVDALDYCVRSLYGTDGNRYI